MSKTIDYPLVIKIQQNFITNMCKLHAPSQTPPWSVRHWKEILPNSKIKELECFSFQVTWQSNPSKVNCLLLEGFFFQDNLEGNFFHLND